MMSVVHGVPYFGDAETGPSSALVFNVRISVRLARFLDHFDVDKIDVIFLGFLAFAFIVDALR